MKHELREFNPIPKNVSGVEGYGYQFNATHGVVYIRDPNGVVYKQNGFTPYGAHIGQYVHDAVRGVLAANGSL